MCYSCRTWKRCTSCHYFSPPRKFLDQNGLPNLTTCMQCRTHKHCPKCRRTLKLKKYVLMKLLEEQREWTREELQTLKSSDKLTRHCFNCRKKDTNWIAQKKMDAAVRGKPPIYFLRFLVSLETQDCAIIMAVVWTSAPRNSPMPLAGPCLLDAMSVETREGLELPRSARKHVGRRSITQRIFLKTESSVTTKATASISTNAFLTSLTTHGYSRRLQTTSQPHQTG
jgi:hypothetical protein